MTCIAAYIGADGQTAIAADSLCSNGGVQYEEVGGKLVHLGLGWWAGCAGVALWGRFAREFSAQLVSGEGALKGCPPSTVPTAFADAWLAWAKERSHGVTENGHWCACGEWVLARHGQVVRIGSDGSVVEPSEGYTAVGSGAQVGLGALWAMRQNHGRGHAVADVARMAVRAASSHASGVGGQVWSRVCAAPSGFGAATSELLVGMEGAGVPREGEEKAGGTSTAGLFETREG